MATRLCIFITFIAAALACGVGQQACGSSCYTPGATPAYTCTTDNKGVIVLCPSTSPAACDGGCYSTSQYYCSSNGLQPVSNQPSTSSAARVSPGVAARSSTTSSAAASTTSSAAASTTSAAASTSAAPVNNNPTPAPVSGLPTQTADLRIINSCKNTLWFEARYGGQGAPIPGQSVTATRALPGGFVDYTVPATGLSGSRFWAKYGCDSNGQNCLIGDQMQYWPNPPGGCPPGGCTPPVDSLFEATWGCKAGSGCASTNPTTWFDTSQVDGYTIPYKLTASGATNQCDCVGSNCGFSGVDATTLSLSRCPSNENLVYGSQTSVTTPIGETVGLSSVDLRIISNSTVLGCMSPCKRLNWGLPYGLGQSESFGSALMMCCPTPTPNNCTPSNGCITPPACRAGPIVNTQYVNGVHTMAPGVYAYSYDDGVGLHACPSGTVIYTMEFCPNGSTYPLQL